MLGRTLSHYKILEEISRGGMGVVYRALDLKLDREVALKVLPPELVADSERKRRFIQEAKAAAKLEHPHIGVVHEIDEAEGVTFIAMERIRGVKLRDLIQKERIPLLRSLELATEVAEGMARAHDQGIVHRDLKPANIMVTEDGHAKIIDFGLAKLVRPLTGERSEMETALRETDPGKVMGTVLYMSPEQARGQEVDHRSDIFTLGIVLYEMVSGEPPFKGASGIDTLSSILREPTPRLAAVEPPVPEEAESVLQPIVDNCLADVFEIQDEIALNIANVLRVKLIEDKEQRKPKRHSENVEAYHLYLKGRYYWHARYEEGMAKAIGFFEQAVEKDPSYALPYTGLADSYCIMGQYGFLPAQVALSKASDHVQRALSLDDRLAEACTSQAMIHYWYDWDWSNAEQEFRRALELGALAECERARIAERVRAGLARVRAAGRRLVRPRALVAEADVRRTAHLSVEAAAARLGVSRSVVQRAPAAA